MIRLTELKPGDVLAHRYESAKGGSQYMFSRVLRVGAKKVRVRSDLGREAWMSPEYFDYRLPPSEARRMDI